MSVRTKFWMYAAVSPPQQLVDDVLALVERLQAGIQFGALVPVRYPVSEKVELGDFAPLIIGMLNQAVGHHILGYRRMQMPHVLEAALILRVFVRVLAVRIENKLPDAQRAGLRAGRA